MILPFTKNYYRIFFLFISGLLFSQWPSSKIINENLDSFPLRESQENVGNFRGKVYSVKHFRTKENQEKAPTDSLIGKQRLTLESFNTYLQDGRTKSKMYYSGTRQYKTVFYYDEINGNLLLRENFDGIDKSKNRRSDWLFYNNDYILIEEIAIQEVNGKLSFKKYHKYKIKDSAQQRKITKIEIGNDSIRDPYKTYIFEGEKLTVKRPLYQKKVEKSILKNGIFYVYEANGYIFPERNVFYKYDKNGKVISEIWYNENGLENKIINEYNTDYTENILIDYHYKGTVVSSRNKTLFDAFGNPVFNQTVYYDGSLGSISEYEYEYDKNNNWIVKKVYYTEVTKGISQKKTLTSTEFRTIKYYNEIQRSASEKIPSTPDFLNEIRRNIPEIANKNAKFAKNRDLAVENNAIQFEISLKEAAELHDFTPEFWEIKDKAFGNLNDDDFEDAVVIYKIPGGDESDQMMAIFRKEKTGWKLWHQTYSPIMSSDSGGMMGNPFSGVSISNKTIVVEHLGGSRLKWAYTNRYRFQNGDWYLIGATNNSGGPCDYFEKFDFNLSTGDATYKYTVENCENGEVKTTINERTNQKIKLPKMDEYSPGGNAFKFPKMKKEIYY